MTVSVVEETNLIQDNIARDRDLDYHVSTSLTVDAGKALDKLVQREYGGNHAAAVRAAVMRMLRQGYWLAE